MLRKLIPALLLILILMTSLTGCMGLGRGIIKEFEDNKDGIMSEVNELKDGIADELNDWLESISKYNITKDKNLKGERKLGVDNYVGSYEAEYIQFNGKEYIFGGTSMERENGNTLKVTYTFGIESGTAKLYWLGSTEDHIISGDKEEHIIVEVAANDVYEFTISAGDNFIVLKGDDFTGSLSLKVE